MPVEPPTIPLQEHDLHCWEIYLLDQIMSNQIGFNVKIRSNLQSAFESSLAHLLEIPPTSGKVS